MTNTPINTLANVLSVTKGAERVSLQDIGRPASQSLGVPASGAADEYGFLLANNLLGNNANSPALEVVFGQISFTVSSSTRIAITGANCTVKRNGEPEKQGTCIHLHANDTIELGAFEKGNYAYIAIKDGFNATPWLESAVSKHESSTNTLVAECEFGYEGNITELPKPLCKPWPFYVDSETAVLRFIPSPAWLNLPKVLKEKVVATSFTIDANSNKMGFRLNADGLDAVAERIKDETSPFSSPVSFGQIQLPAAAQWIVLMKDRQTMGGYPSIGTVMKTDLFRLSQLRAGTTVRFIPIAFEQAQLQLSAFYQRLNLIP
ncbi:biotin-dependent carboxyltransferase family protein [Thalassotalea euphylliae]|uniref:5-oxoprolinase subunit C family protein n=1 Tax=Thalassotalea euphylliae TaxID=1655234 RepID=UPI003632C7A0